FIPASCCNSASVQLVAQTSPRASGTSDLRPAFRMTFLASGSPGSARVNPLPQLIFDACRVQVMRPIVQDISSTLLNRSASSSPGPLPLSRNLGSLLLPPLAARRGGRLYRRRDDSAAAFGSQAVPPRPAGRE